MTNQGSNNKNKMKNFLEKLKSRLQWKKSVLVLFFVLFVVFLPVSLSYNLPQPVFEAQSQSTESQNYRIFELFSNSAAATDAEASENYKPNWVERYVYDAIGYLAKGIIWLQGWILSMLISILMALMRYNGFVNAHAVRTGWTLVRDVANMFFALIILAIALGTILKIESYNIKRLLPKVLLMAVLVNFSRTICGLMIDFAQVIMITFAASFAAVGGQGAGNMVKLLKIDSIVYYTKKLGGSSNEPIKYLNVVISAILAVILLAIALVVVLVMVVVILMRMIMLWVLLVLSPLPFILSAFPQGEKYAQQFWQEFTKYVIVGPVIAFFLWLSFAVVNQDFDDELKKVSTGMEDKPSTGNDIEGETIITQIGEIDDFLKLIIGIGMLMASLMVTQQLGVAGGGFAGSMYGKIRGAGIGAVTAPFRGAYSVARLGVRETGGLISRRVANLSQKGGVWRAAALLSPRAIKEGFAASKAEADEVAYPEAAAGIQDFVNRYNPLTRRKTQHQRRARRASVAKYQSDLAAQNFSEMELAQEFENEFNSKSADIDRLNAIMRQQVMNKQEDDHEVGVRDGEYGPESNMMERIMRIKNKYGEETAAEVAGDLTDIAESASKTRAMGMVTQKYDKKRNKVIRQLNLDPYSHEQEQTTRMNRAELQRLLPGLEGKFVRRTVAKAKKMLNPFSNKEFESNMINYDSFGVANWRSVPRKMADVINKRGHSLAERVKETIGFNDVINEETGEKEARLTSVGALIDAFKGNPKVAGAVLANLNLEKSEYQTVHKILKSEAAKSVGIDPKKIDEVFSQPILRDSTGRDSMTLEQSQFIDRLEDGRLTFRKEKLHPDHLDANGDPLSAFKGYEPTILYNTENHTGYGAVRGLTEEEEPIPAGARMGAKIQEPLVVQDPNKIRGVKTASSTKKGAVQAGVGINFEDSEIQKKFGVKAGQDAVYYKGDDINKAIKSLGEIYRRQLAEEGKTGKDLEEAVNRFIEGLKNAGSLRIHNNNAGTGNIAER